MFCVKAHVGVVACALFVEEMEEDVEGGVVWVVLRHGG